jgi:proteasome lid subunit RPN8/RPN11
LDERANHLIISEIHWRKILQHIQACSPEKGCGVAGGVLEGRVARVDLIIPVVNQLHSPVRYQMDPAGQLAAFTEIEDRGLELVAIFHSHPDGPQVPSQTDLAEFYYPGVLSLIGSRAAGEQAWILRAFQLGEDHFAEVLVDRLEK